MAAERAESGDTITVHEGTYRERVDPPRGGTADDERIVYRAAPGETVVVKGSEVVDDWKRVEGELWRTTLSDSFFDGYNPYEDRIRGDWFDDQGRDHHTGDVYLDSTSLREVASHDALLAADGGEYAWYGEVEGSTTTIWARFGGDDPHEATVEINVRPAVFYPETPGLEYITVRGFRMCHAATQWAPPTTEQIGLLGTHWGLGWVIEDNIISHSRCTGITLGKYGESIDDTGASAERYNETIRDALENGWEKGNVGGHVVRNNTIFNCEQAGIVGSMGAAFSDISENHIYNINVEGQFGGAEIAGIKFHGPIDTTIKHNHVHRARRGIWLDWMTQGTRVTGNLLYENDSRDDLFLEVNHGPFVIDNNILLSDTALRIWSQGGAYAHNLIVGDVVQQPELDRSTPFHEPHSTEIAGLSNIEGGDDRFYNNVFVGHNGLRSYDEATLPVHMDGNVFLDGADPSTHEAEPITRPHSDPDIELVDKEESVSLGLTIDDAWKSAETELVTTELLNSAKIPDARFTNPDGTPLRIDTDYLGSNREEETPAPGPFARLEEGEREFKVWPR